MVVSILVAFLHFLFPMGIPPVSMHASMRLVMDAICFGETNARKRGHMLAALDQPVAPGSGGEISCYI
jgi:hypothetical protein